MLNIFFMKDTQPPSFGETCPPERNVVADEGKTTATVNWEPIKATDNEDATVTVLPDVTSPHNFPEGSHTVIHTARDPSGNTESCHLRVNVQGNTIYELMIIILDHFTSDVLQVVSGSVWQAQSLPYFSTILTKLRLKY